MVIIIVDGDGDDDGDGEDGNGEDGDGEDGGKDPDDHDGMTGGLGEISCVVLMRPLPSPGIV